VSILTSIEQNLRQRHKVLIILLMQYTTGTEKATYCKQR